MLLKLLKNISSINFTAYLLIAFMILVFWGTLAQVNAESLGYSTSYAVKRFFDSYFIEILGYIPLPAFKFLSLIAIVHLISSMIFCMPRGIKNIGLYGMHIALVILLFGSLLGSSIKKEYNGFSLIQDGLYSNVLNEDLNPLNFSNIKFYSIEDSLGINPIELVKNDSSSILNSLWPYYIKYEGYVEMSPQKKVAMYKAYYDPLRFIPYIFMIIFFVSALYHFFVKSHILRYKKNGISSLFLFILFSVIFSHTSVSAKEDFELQDTIKIAQSELVKFNNDIRVFDSFARGFLDDLSGKVTYKKCENISIKPHNKMCYKLKAYEVVNHILNDSIYNANDYKIFKILQSDVSYALNLNVNERYVSYNDLIKSRNLLEFYANRNDNHPTTKEIKRLYDNFLFYDSIKNLKRIHGDSTLMLNNSFISDNLTDIEFLRKKAKYEVFYNNANYSFIAFLFAFFSCILSAIYLIYKKNKLKVFAVFCCLISSLFLVILLCSRLFITGCVPLSNLYEIVLVVSLLLNIFECVIFFVLKKQTYSLVFSVSLMVLLLLFFARFILESGDLFQKIPSILNSSIFLTIHVFTIAVGFSAMILSGMVSHIALIKKSSFILLNIEESDKKKNNDENLFKLIYGILVVGGIFTILGTLMGGVWADFAWGRFWGFDPKECGALFVCLWAMLLLHLRKSYKVKTFLWVILNCFSIIVTFLCWFGINLLGVGLHSYGFQNGTAIWLITFVILDLIFICTFWLLKQGALRRMHL